MKRTSKKLWMGICFTMTLALSAGASSLGQPPLMPLRQVKLIRLFLKVPSLWVCVMSMEPQQAIQDLLTALRSLNMYLHKMASSFHVRPDSNQLLALSYRVVS